MLLRAVATPLRGRTTPARRRSWPSSRRTASRPRKRCSRGRSAGARGRRWGCLNQMGGFHPPPKKKEEGWFPFNYLKHIGLPGWTKTSFGWERNKLWQVSVLFPFPTSQHELQVFFEKEQPAWPLGCMFFGACRGGCGLRYNWGTASRNPDQGNCLSTTMLCQFQ